MCRAPQGARRSSAAAYHVDDLERIAGLERDLGVALTADDFSIVLDRHEDRVDIVLLQKLEQRKWSREVALFPVDRQLHGLLPYLTDVRTDDRLHAFLTASERRAAALYGSGLDRTALMTAMPMAPARITSLAVSGSTPPTPSTGIPSGAASSIALRPTRE